MVMSLVCCLTASHRPSIDSAFPCFDFEPTDTSAGSHPWFWFSLSSCLTPFLSGIDEEIPLDQSTVDYLDDQAELQWARPALWGDPVPTRCSAVWPQWPLSSFPLVVVMRERYYVMYFVRWIILRVFWFHCIRFMYWHSVGLCLWALYYSILRVLFY